MFVEFSNVHQEVYSCRGIPLWRVSPWPGVSSGVFGSAICSCSFGARTGRESEWVSQEIGLARATQQTILPLALQPLYLPGFIKELKYLPAYGDPRCGFHLAAR